MTTKRTFRDRRKRLIEALRSGNYKKITGNVVKLNKKEEPIGYCVLGVAAQVYNQCISKKFRISDVELQDDDLNEVNDFFGGLNEDNIITLNDNTKKTFKQIADTIEKNPQDYFL